MDKQQILDFLSCIGVPPSSTTYTGGGWVGCRCPLAPFTHDSGKDSNPSFAIKVDPHGESHFNCFTCHSGDLLYLLQLLRKFGAEKPKYRIGDAAAVLAIEAEGGTNVQIAPYDDLDTDVEVDKPWPEDWLASFVSALHVPDACNYLHKRGLTNALIFELDIRWDSSLEAVCFPVRNWHGELMGLRGRHVDSEEWGKPYHRYKYKDYLNRLVWYGENRVDLEKPVLLVESVFDYAAVYPVYPNILAPLTVGMSPEKIKRIASAYDIVTLFDNGTGGTKAREKISKVLEPMNLIIAHLTPPDNRSDPGECTPDELIEVLTGYLPI